jgi:gamma-tubulin complex component 4
MFHELLLALAGYPGDVFVEGKDGFMVSPDLPWMSEQERTILNRLCKLGWSFHICTTFISTFRQSRHGDKPHGIYVNAFCHGLDQVLNGYRHRLAKIEAGCLVDQTHDVIQVENEIHSKPIRTLADILAILLEDELIFPALLRVIEQIQQDPTSWHGVKLIEQLRKLYLETGIPLLRDIFRDLTVSCLRVLWRQVTGWLVYGLLRDPYQEFFIDTIHQEKDDTVDTREPLWRRRHAIRTSMIPSWMSTSTVEDTLFVGQVVLAVQERQHTVPTTWTEARLQELNELVISVNSCQDRLETGGESFARIARTARRDLSDWLWRIAVQKYQALEQLGSFRDYFLLGRGDFVDALLDAVERYRQSASHTVTAPTLRDRELRALWSRAAANTSAEHDPCFARFQLERAPDLSDAEVFGVPVRLRYTLEWPFDLMVAPTELARYDAVFLCLLAVRSAQHRLQHSKWRVLSRHYLRSKEDQVALRRLWHLRNLMQCFVDQVWLYMQMDVIQVHFHRLCQYLQGAVDGVLESDEHDFTDLQLAHTRFLDAIWKGCLIATPAVSSAMRAAIRCCAQLAGFMEAAQQVDNMSTLLTPGVVEGLEGEFLKHAAFVFRTLSSVSHIPSAHGSETSLEADVRRHLDQLLLRLDYNQWYSSQSMTSMTNQDGIILNDL